MRRRQMLAVIAGDTVGVRMPGSVPEGGVCST